MNKKIVQYCELLAEWKEKINLISFSSREELFSKHIFDCQQAVRFFAPQHAQNILDIGSGGGLPGIVLAILLPQSRFTLVDSTRKKIIALQDMCLRLELHNVDCVWGHTNDLARDSRFSGKFDVVTARAVAPLPRLLPMALPFLRRNGFLLAFKGPKYTEELAAADIGLSEKHAFYGHLHTSAAGHKRNKHQKKTHSASCLLAGRALRACCTLEKIFSYELPGNMGSRVILLIRKR